VASGSAASPGPAVGDRTQELTSGAPPPSGLCPSHRGVGRLDGVRGGAIDVGGLRGIDEEGDVIWLVRHDINVSRGSAFDSSAPFVRLSFSAVLCRASFAADCEHVHVLGVDGAENHFAP
jgi:hypothetical protein